MTQDDVRTNFLLTLERANIKLTPSEAGFVDSCLGQLSFSSKQRKWIDSIMAKYDDAVKAARGEAPSLAAQAQVARAAYGRDASRFKVGTGSFGKRPSPISSGGNHG